MPVYKSPEKLLDELGITEPEEIDIEAIAEYCRATVVYNMLSGCEGRILGYGERAIITVNNASHRERQRFSAAHELGHWMCDQGNIALSCTEKMFNEAWFQNSDREVRANRYAADILLPKVMFTQKACKREITFTTVQELANTFNTSLTATAIRLVEHGSYPAMIVCTNLNGRKWFTRGPDVPSKIWPYKSLDRESLAYDLLAGISTNQSPTNMPADVWIDHPDAHQYVIREHSVKITDDLVLTLLWWKDERQLLDF